MENVLEMKHFLVGVSYRVPSRFHPLLLELGVLPPVVDGRQNFPEQDEHHAHGNNRAHDAQHDAWTNNAVLSNDSFRQLPRRSKLAKQLGTDPRRKKGKEEGQTEDVDDWRASPCSLDTDD